jgi:pyridoxamine 5'-phosphate oxidase
MPLRVSGDEKMHDIGDRCQRFSEGKRAALPLVCESSHFILSSGTARATRAVVESRAMNVAQLRQEYMRSGLSEQDAGADPLRLFSAWLEDAVRAGLPLPNAMTLATVTPEGAPDARIVLLKGLEHGGFAFYTNYSSRKARQLAARPAACLVFQWSELERQVRIEGGVEKVSAADSDAYFSSRPLGARLSAWASEQSATVASRQVLESAMQEARKRHGDSPPRPAHWGGYRVLAHRMEFWQGRADRLHDRLLYTRADAGWKIERLAP